MRPVMLVTGGSRGIGAATARLAIRRGFDLCVSYREAAGQAHAIAQEAEASGSRVVAVKADIADERGTADLFAALDSAFGRLDVLVNNAGITGPMTRLADLERADLVRVVEVNVIGAFMVAREAVRRMSNQKGGRGGAIINVSSRAAQIGGAGEFLHYAASKGAIETMTVGLAREVAGEGIRVNAVSPGLIDTEIHDAPGGRQRVQRLVPGVPMARIGSAGEVAETILWLASQQASYVTGASVPVSGGR